MVGKMHQGDRVGARAVKAAAFCPGHLTGFFEICDAAPEPARRGSRGGGFSVSLGAISEVEVRPADAQSLEVSIAPGMEGEVTRRALAHLMKKERLEVVVRTRLELPISQGFGMSGAGALSDALAFVHAAGDELGLSRDDAVCAAHVAEVESRTGLGDVVAQAVGGAELRLEPGIPPHGTIRSWRENRDVMLCVLGAPMRTKDVLTSAEMTRRIASAGRVAMEKCGALQSLDVFRITDISYEFARDSGLLSREISSALSAIEGWGRGSMAMLGNALFAIGEVGAIEHILSNYGCTFRCSVSALGARALQRSGP